MRKILQILQPNAAKAADTYDVVINEIAWMGTVNSVNDEWIELYNQSSQAIELTGWTLKAVDGQPAINLSGSIAAGGYFLLERTSDDTVSEVTADQIYTGALGNSGEVLELRDNVNNLIDKIDASAGWPAGDNTTKATLERKIDGSWQTSATPGGSPKAQNSVGVQLVTPVCGNGQIETGEQCDDGNTISGDGCSNDCKTETPTATTTPPASTFPVAAAPSGSSAVQQNNLGDIVINEFVSDPGDNDVEWIELYNTTGKEINISGWTVEDGSKTKTNLTAQLGSSVSARFYVIEKPKGILNNSGDIIILRDQTGKIIDQVSYGNWDDGNKDNNAPVANDPDSVARIFDGQNSYNNAYDFVVTTNPTKGSSNVIIKESEVSAANKAKYNYSDDIFISEIFPNPVGSDNEKEFIEIYNRGKSEVNLAGWSLSNDSDKKKMIEAIATSSVIYAGSYLVIYRPRSKIVLKNDADEVKLYQPLADDPLQTIKYEKTIEGWSYALDENCIASSTACTWQWTETVTPGQTNIIKRINKKPEVNFTFSSPVIAGQPVSFDSSDTIDEDCDKLTFTWDFGDGLTNNLSDPEHTFLKTGTYTVKLSVSDQSDSTTEEKLVKVYGSLIEAAMDNEKIISSPVVLGMSNAGQVVLNELLPNPVGDDASGEWIELANQSPEKINLINWRIATGNQKSYSFSGDLWLDAGQYYLLKRAVSKLTLNNQADTLSLYDDLNQLIDSVTYQDTSEGEAYARGANGKWFWTTVLTPGQENIIEVAQSKNIIKSTMNGVSSSAKLYAETNLADVKNYEVGDLVKVKGLVAVEPGILGTQIFYIISPTSTSTANIALASVTTEAEQTIGGIQVYSYKKDFPVLKVGDYIEVSGQLAQSAGELRLKTTNKADIKIIKHYDSPQPQTLTCDKISEDLVGQLLSVTGDITDRKSSTIYLDDGTDEVQVYVKSLTGIDPKNFAAGEKLTVAGILGKTNNGVRLLPRYIEDMVKINAANAAEPQVIGEVAASDQWQLAARDKKLELFKYLLIMAGGVIIILIVFMIKSRKR